MTLLKALGEWQLLHPTITAWLDWVMWIPLMGWIIWVSIMCYKK